MNMSNVLHAALALMAQAGIGLLTGNWWAGAAFGIGFYAGREVAQHETDKLKYFGKRAGVLDGEGMPWYEGFKVSNWSTDGKLDLLVPCVAVVAVALVMTGGIFK